MSEENIIQLKGFVNTTPACAEEGTFVGQGGDLFNVIDIDKHIEYYTIERLALALSRSIRYLGNSKMTVAQHCVRGSEFFILKGDIRNAHNFLMHEISEPFGVSDISTPIKKILGDTLKQIEHNIESKLSKKFGYDYPFPKEIKLVDKNLAIDEMTMMKHENPLSDKKYYVEFDYWNQEKSYNQFLLTYRKIQFYMEYESKEIVK